MKIVRIDSRIAVRRRTMLILFEGSTAIGHIMLDYHKRKSAEFYNLFVSKKRKGYGSRLVDECERIARKAGCESLRCLVDGDNHRVIPFYRHLDFFISGEWDSGSVVMVKKLAPQRKRPTMNERMTVRRIDPQTKSRRTVLYGDDPNYRVIADLPSPDVLVGDEIEYEPDGVNFGWFKRNVSRPSSLSQARRSLSLL